mmetsp:Transcript_3179/g.6445  ORF Transcript_3179/g.6445 Transcript_3179/m.6445 type:complete len:226 (+) Transcript_3179:206-883(+)
MAKPLVDIALLWLSTETEWSTPDWTQTPCAASVTHHRVMALGNHVNLLSLCQAERPRRIQTAESLAYCEMLFGIGLHWLRNVPLTWRIRLALRKSGGYGGKHGLHNGFGAVEPGPATCCRSQHPVNHPLTLTAWVTTIWPSAHGWTPMPSHMLGQLRTWLSMAQVFQLCRLQTGRLLLCSRSDRTTVHAKHATCNFAPDWHTCCSLPMWGGAPVSLVWLLQAGVR